MSKHRKEEVAEHRRAKRGRSEAPSPEALRRFVRARAAEFLADPNITSIGIGIKGGVPCIQFTVGKKVAKDVAKESKLEALGALRTRLIDPWLEVDGVRVPTDVVERKYRKGFEVIVQDVKDARKQRLETLVPGISVSHPTGTAGTLGAIVYDTKSGAPCILSNWHVLHGPEGILGDQIVQPGPHDDNRVSENRAGVLIRSHLGAAGDCAIARIEDRSFDATVYELGVKVKAVARPDIGDVLVKSGRTTGITRGRVRRVDVVAKIDYEGDIGSRNIGGFEIGPLEDADPNFEISMGGDSGSAWLVAGAGGDPLAPTEVMAGLHFAGEGTGNPDEHALACYAHSVFEKLEISLEPPRAADEIEQGFGGGFDAGFLPGVRVPVPRLPGKKRRDFVAHAGSPLIPYTHFSVCLSPSRRFAHFVAWNIDGEALKAYGRKGLAFKLDPRIDPDFQTDDRLYSDNKLDRGHLARRADVVWGPAKEAQQANRDSFYFTNIAPQHRAFNQSRLGGLWGELEDAILEELNIARLRLSVMAGPIFKKKDPTYRGTRIPRSFWKVISFVDADDGQLKVKAYVLTQSDLLNDIEAFDLDPFRLFQVSVRELETTAGLAFDASLAKADAFAHPQGIAAEMLPHRAVREILPRNELLGA